MKVFTLRFSERVQGFNDEPVREFVRDKDVVEVRDHFFEHDGVPYLCLLVTYRACPETPPPQPQAGSTRKGKEKDAWRAELSEADWPLFNALREWRSERAKADAVPVYVIATNQQFVDIVKKRPDTLSLLSSVDGFGQAKLKRYGKDLLRIVSGAPPPKRDPPTDGSPPPARESNKVRNVSDSKDEARDPGRKTP